MKRAIFLFCATLTVFCSAGTATMGQAVCKGSNIFASEPCDGDSISPAEAALYEAISDYRKQSGRPPVRLSGELSKLANRHLLDIRLNLKQLTHSWSNCDYDVAVKETWPCSMNAPVRLGTKYTGQGYELLYLTSRGTVAPQIALDSWKSSSLHNSIILNLGMFRDFAWDEIGIGIDGAFAAIWFGKPTMNAAATATRQAGLGVSFGQASRGISEIIELEQKSASDSGNKWVGTSDDKQFSMEMYGSAGEITQAKLRISVQTEPNRRPSPKNSALMSALLNNIRPGWEHRDAWIEKTLKVLEDQPDGSRTLNIQGISVELRNAGSAIELNIRPAGSSVPREIF